MAEKKGQILIRFPEDLAEDLRKTSFDLKIPIKDIVADIIGKNLPGWKIARLAETEKIVIKELKEYYADSVDDNADNVAKLQQIVLMTEGLMRSLTEKSHDSPPNQSLSPSPSPESPTPQAPASRSPSLKPSRKTNTH
jgi:hypothetical protein